MSYQELYKKYRPTKWEHFVGQEIVINSLKKSIETSRIPTAYLFHGAPGTGKTSVAFMLAAALNAEHLDENQNPIDSPLVRNVFNNNVPGIVYVSMANSGSAADVRKLVEQAKLATTLKKQVFILDEVHRLSKEAFDSLLIPLESTEIETLFILCSTEIHKIPAAVQSRTQIKMFTPVQPKLIYAHLKRIVKKEKLEVDDSVLKKIAIEGGGSVRNAIRDLESHLSGETSSKENYQAQLISAICDKNLADAYQVVSKLEASGEDIVRFSETLYKTFVNYYMGAFGVKVPLTETSKKNILILKEDLPNILEELGESLKMMSYNQIDKRILLDIALGKILGGKNE